MQLDFPKDFIPSKPKPFAIRREYTDTRKLLLQIQEKLEYKEEEEEE